MSAKQYREPRPLASEPPQRQPDSPYLKADEAAVYLRFASTDAFYQAIRTHNIPLVRRGRTLLFTREQLDRWMAGESRVELLREVRSRKAGR
jgi:excisionase family DNA binding protein